MQGLSTLYRDLRERAGAPRSYDAIERAFGLTDGPGGETFEKWIERCIMALVGLTQGGRRELLDDGDVRDSRMEFDPYEQRIRLRWGHEFAAAAS